MLVIAYCSYETKSKVPMTVTEGCPAISHPLTPKVHWKDCNCADVPGSHKSKTFSILTNTSFWLTITSILCFCASLMGHLLCKKKIQIEC